MKFINKRSNLYRCLAILVFFGSGAGSIYLFYQVPGWPFLQGIDEESFRTVVSFAWVMIFPLWIVLYFAAMALLGIFLRMPDS